MSEAPLASMGGGCARLVSLDGQPLVLFLFIVLVWMGFSHSAELELCFGHRLYQFKKGYLLSFTQA